tara:strand:+ start:2808 stop:5057 length:2250 start_codon:yes stop_codon:yes gene_type:complete
VTYSLLKTQAKRLLFKRVPIVAVLFFIQVASAVEFTPIVPSSKGTFRGRPTVNAIRVEIPPEINGVLDDEVWQLAKPAGEFLQKSPQQNVPHSQRTEFRVLYDDNALYIAVWCFDDTPSAIIAKNMQRDEYMRSEDIVNITLDTFLDRRNGYYFSVNSLGARGDSSISNNTSVNSEWDGAWVARCKKQIWGWAAEFEIPFKSISFDENNSVWGINVYRNIGRYGERGQWANSRSVNKSFNVSECGDLLGLFGLKQGLGLDINPYIVGTYQKDYDKNDSDLLGDFGFDVRYRLTPSLTALASVNTDFAQTEVDERQLNLTRFPLFFPEKRQFFLEDSGIFGFGGTESISRRSRDSSSTLLIPFFSRRIGLSSDGEVDPIQFAGKLTGRVKSYNIGFLDAIVESKEGTRNVFVGRVSKNIYEQSSIGFLSTIGDPNSDEMNVLAGTDFQFRSSDMFGGRNFRVNAYALASYSEEIEDIEPAWNISSSLEDRNIDLSASITEIGEEFDPAMGFVRRRGNRRYTAELDFIPYHDGLSWLRNTRHGYDAEMYTDIGNSVINTKQRFDLATFFFESQDVIGLSFSHITDRPSESFSISDGTEIPAGDYEWWGVNLRGYIGMHRRAYFGPFYSMDGYYGGLRHQFGLESYFSPWPNLKFGGKIEKNLIELESSEDLDITISRLEFNYNFTPDLILSNMLQYDNISESLGVNSRFQWEYKPGAKMFLVVNQGYLDERTGLVMKEFEVVTKIGALFRF